MKLWIVGKIVATDRHIEWEFQGVFDDEVLAREACTTIAHFVGPARLNARAPEERVEWPGAYYPLLETYARTLNV